MMSWSSQLPVEPLAARFRLVGIDLDGIVQPDNSLHPSDSAAIRTAHAGGVKVVLVSARPPEEIHRYWALLGLGTPVIALNGALVYDYPARHTLTGQSLPTDVLGRALQVIQDLSPKAAVGLELEDSWAVNRLGAVAKWRIDHTGNWPASIGKLRGSLDRSVYQLWIDGDGADLNRLADRLADPGVALMRYTSPDRLVVRAAAASRGWALSALAAQLNIPPHQIMAIGDGGYDRSMLQAAAFAVLTNERNAQGEFTNEIAVTRGVAEALEQYIVPVTGDFWPDAPTGQPGEEDEWQAAEL